MAASIRWIDLTLLLASFLAFSDAVPVGLPSASHMACATPEAVTAVLSSGVGFALVSGLLLGFDFLYGVEAMAAEYMECLRMFTLCSQDTRFKFMRVRHCSSCFAKPLTSASFHWNRKDGVCGCLSRIVLLYVIPQSIEMGVWCDTFAILSLRIESICL